MGRQRLLSRKADRIVGDCRCLHSITEVHEAINQVLATLGEPKLKELFVIQRALMSAWSAPLRSNERIR